MYRRRKNARPLLPVGTRVRFTTDRAALDRSLMPRDVAGKEELIKHHTGWGTSDGLSDEREYICTDVGRYPRDMTWYVSAECVKPLEPSEMGYL